MKVLKVLKKLIISWRRSNIIEYFFANIFFKCRSIFKFSNITSQILPRKPLKVNNLFNVVESGI